MKETCVKAFGSELSMILSSEKECLSLLEVKVLALAFLNLLSKRDNAKETYQLSSIQREHSPSSAAAPSFVLFQWE